MSSGTGVQFSIHTGEAIASLKALRQELSKTLAAMGGSSAPQTSKLTKDLKQVEKSTNEATASTRRYSSSLDDNVRSAMSWSQKINDINIRFSGSVKTSHEAAQAAMKQTQMVMMDPSSWAYQQKKMAEDAKAAKEWSLLRRARASSISDWDTKTRREDLAKLKADIIQRSYAETSSYAFRQEEFTKHLAKMTALSSSGRAKELAELKKGMIEFSAERSKHNEKVRKETLDQYRTLERAQANHLAALARQEQKAMAFRESSLQSQISKINKVIALQQSGRFSDAAILSRHGSEAVGAVQNLPELQRQLAIQKEMEKVEKAAERARNRGTTSVNKNTTAIRNNSRAMHDARGAARGLSGALGQLWMTYGSIAPLVAGAAIGTIARQTYEVGKDVEFRLKMLEALGNRAIQIAEMMPAVHGSMKTPLEAAEGLQQLAQAGLNAEESLAVLGTTLQLATLGEMSVADAARTTTAALSTFNLEIWESVRVGDVFAKTASISNTSVADITSAMRMAGSAAAIYGISIEDTAAQIAMLAQNGIRASAAGTAFRNAMTELHAPTAKAQALMKELGIEVFDATKSSRDYMDVIGDLREAYYGLNEEGQAAMLKGMFNERSRRYVQITIKDYDELAEILEKVKDNQGFLVEANAKLLDSVEGASNRMASVFQQSLVGSFEESKPLILEAIRNLEELFASDKFKKGVTDLTNAIANFTSFLSDHAETIVRMTAAYAAWRLAVLPLAGLVTRTTGAVNQLTTSYGSSSKAAASSNKETKRLAATLGGLAGASAASSIGMMGAVGSVSRFLGPIGVAIGLLTTAVSLFQSYRAGALNAEEGQDSFTSGVQRAIREIDIQNEALEKTIALQKLAAEGKSEIYYGLEGTRGEAYDRINQAVEELAELNKKIEGIENPQTPAEKTRFASSRTGEKNREEALRKLNAQKAKQVALIEKETQGLTKLDQRLEVHNKRREEAAEGSILTQASGIYAEITNLARFNQDSDVITALAKQAAELKVAQAEKETALPVKEYHDRLQEIAAEINSNLPGLKIDSDKPSGLSKFERDLETFQQWYEKQLIAIDTQKGLTEAYLEGRDAVNEYNLKQQIEEQVVKDKTESYELIRAVLTELNKERDRAKVAEEIFNLSESTKKGKEYITVLHAQSKGYEAGRKALDKFNKEQALLALLAGRSKENVQDLIDEFNRKWDENNEQDKSIEAIERINSLVEQTKNSHERYQESLAQLERDRAYATTAEQVRALNLAIQQLHIENNTFLQALDQGFTDLEKNAGKMWETFLEEGKFSMDSIQGSFKKMLAQMAHEALTKPIMISIQNAVMGTNVAGGWGQVYGGGGGGIDPLTGASFASKMMSGAGASQYGMVGGMSWFNNFGGNISNTIADWGANLAMSNGALSNFGGTLLNNAEAIGKFADITGDVFGYGSAIYDLTKGNYGAAAGGAIGTYFGGPVGSFLGSTLGGAVDKLFGGGETRVGGGALIRADGSIHRNGGGPSGGDGGPEARKAVDQVLASALGSIEGLFTALDIEAQIDYLQATFESSGKGRGGTQSGGALRIGDEYLRFGVRGKGSGYGGKTGTAEEMFENMTKDMSFSILEAWQLAADQMPNTIANMLNGINVRSMDPEAAGNLAQEIYGIVQTVNTLSDALKLMPFENLKNQTFDLNYALLEAAGGIDNLMGGLNYFYENFYDDQEKFTHLSDQLSKAFEELGHSVPDTKSAYRSLMEAQDVSTESGRELYTALLNLAPTFVDVQQRAIDLEEAVEDLADDFMSATDIARQRADLEKQIMQLTGDVEGLRRLELEGIHESNQALQERIWSLQKEQEVTKEREGLEKQILQLTDQTETLRRMELSTLHSSNHSLQVRIWALQDEREAQEKLAQAYTEAKSATDSALSSSQNLGRGEISRLEKTFSRTDQIFNQLQSSLNGRISELKNILNSLGATIRELRNEAGLAAMHAHKGWDILEKAIRSGLLPAADKLKEATEAIRLDMGDKAYATTFDRDRDRLILANKLEKLEDLAEPQLSTAERQLERAQQQLNTLRGIQGTVGSTDATAEHILQLSREFDTAVRAEERARIQIDRINAQMDMMQQQLDSLREIDEGVMSLGEALSELSAAMKAEAEARAAADAIKSSSSGGEYLKVGTQAWANSYLLHNPDVDRAFRSTSDKMGSLDFANYHYNTYGKAEGRTWWTAGSSTRALEEVILNSFDGFGEDLGDVISLMADQLDVVQSIDLKTLDLTTREDSLSHAKTALEAAQVMHLDAQVVREGSLSHAKRALEEAQLMHIETQEAQARMHETTLLRQGHLLGTLVHHFNYLTSVVAQVGNSISRSLVGFYHEVHAKIASVDAKADQAISLANSAMAAAYASAAAAAANQTQQVPAFAQGGMHTGGLRLVGEFGPELEVTGPGRIHNVQRTQEMLSNIANPRMSQNDNSMLIVQENRKLREENDKLMRVMINMQHRQVKLLERWEMDGMPEPREWTN